MASSSCNPSKRPRYNLSVRKPAIIHGNVQVKPPQGYDDEGKLPESLPPTPTIDLITEDESEVERTPQHAPQRPTLQQLNPEEIENEADHFEVPLPRLTPLRRRGGKNMAVLASIREETPELPESPESPPPSQSQPPSASPTPSQTSSQEDDGQQRDILQFIEEARRRLDREKRQMARLIPKIQRRREAANEEIAAIRRHMAMLERVLEEKVVVLQQCDAELQSIENFCE